MNPDNSEIGSGIKKSTLIIGMFFVLALLIVLGFSKVMDVKQENVDKEVVELVQNIGESIEEYVSENSDVDDSDSVNVRLIETELGETQILVNVGEYKFENISTDVKEINIVTVGKARNFKILGFSESGKNNTDWKSAAIYEFEKD